MRFYYCCLVSSQIQVKAKGEEHHKAVTPAIGRVLDGLKLKLNINANIYSSSGSLLDHSTNDFSEDLLI